MPAAVHVDHRTGGYQATRHTRPDRDAPDAKRRYLATGKEPATADRLTRREGAVCANLRDRLGKPPRRFGFTVSAQGRGDHR